jgi:CheY-like chemotaxis protein
MSARRSRILVIDDEPQIRRFLGPALDAAGYEPIRADTGATGLAANANHPCDAVIFDLGLPGMDGKETLRRAREFIDVPILMLSARDREMKKIKALDAAEVDEIIAHHERHLDWCTGDCRMGSAGAPLVLQLGGRPPKSGAAARPGYFHLPELKVASSGFKRRLPQAV